MNFPLMVPFPQSPSFIYFCPRLTSFAFIVCDPIEVFLMNPLCTRALPPRMVRSFLSPFANLVHLPFSSALPISTFRSVTAFFSPLSRPLLLITPVDLSYSVRGAFFDFTLASRFHFLSFPTREQGKFLFPMQRGSSGSFRYNYSEAPRARCG